MDPSIIADDAKINLDLVRDFLRITDEAETLHEIRHQVEGMGCEFGYQRVYGTRYSCTIGFWWFQDGAMVIGNCTLTGWTALEAARECLKEVAKVVEHAIPTDAKTQHA